MFAGRGTAPATRGATKATTTTTKPAMSKVCPKC